MLLDVIDRISHISDMMGFSESYEDERCRVDLLFKKDSRIDVLISPEGFKLEDMNYKIYLRFDNQKSYDFAVLQNAAVSKHITRKGKNYFVLEELFDERVPPERKKFVLPFQSAQPFPFRILPKSFTKSLEEAINAEKEPPELSEAGEVIHIKTVDKPLLSIASIVYDTFADIPDSQFEPLKKFDRNISHIPLVSIKYHMLSDIKEYFSHFKTNLKLLPLKVIAGTISEQKRNLVATGEQLYELDFGTGEKNMDLLKKYNMAATEINTEAGNSIGATYRASLLLAAALSFANRFSSCTV